MRCRCSGRSTSGCTFSGETVDELRRRKHLEELRIAARDLLGLDPLEVTTAALSTSPPRCSARLTGSLARAVRQSP